MERELTFAVADGRQVTARYLPHEERDMAEHISAGEKARVPKAVIVREIRFLHELKGEFDAVLLP